MIDPLHPKCPHGTPEGWEEVTEGYIQAGYLIYDVLYGWVMPHTYLGKPVSKFGSVIKRKEWRDPKPGEKWSLGGRELIFVALGYMFSTDAKCFICIDEHTTGSPWLVMMREEWFESGIERTLVSKNNDTKYLSERIEAKSQT